MAEHEAQICPKCSTLLTLKYSRFTEETLPRCEKCDVWYDDDLLELEQQRREKRLAEKDEKLKESKRKEDSNPLEIQNDTNRLLQQIEENTRRTKEVSEKFLFWFITLPLVIGAIILIIQGCD